MSDPPPHASTATEGPPRWVLDTNVLVSALLFPAGRLTWLRDAWRSGIIVPLASRETTTELIRVLCYPRFGLTPNEREDLLADHLPHCESVVVSTPPPIPDCRDPFDRPFLELAKAGQADALVTGDKDLHSLAPAFPIPILTPAAALATLPAW
ncbi:MAG: putative toxin-antitoxin system toxin component, PIN family [Gemmatimonadota bacterium]|nr:putative toxin-antitoxin system toxin component, PIN family [Gemmatimonadota bacterium]MDE2983874.1 putative toxin-antitoxin system toxin component, PIN family [Gemmatimonadota bacterium]